MNSIEKLILRIWNDGTFQDAVVSLLKSLSGGPLKSLIIGFLADKFFDDILEPAVNEGIRRRKFHANVKDGKLKLERLENAKNDKDWDTANDDIFI